MRNLILIIGAMALFLISGCNSCSKERKKVDPTELNKKVTKTNAVEILDTVIIGAGMSGLTAAHKLRDKNVLVLEKNSHVGGRILKREFNGIKYNSGAYYGYLPIMCPEGFSCDKLIKNSDPKGFYYKDQLYLGDSLIDAMKWIVNKEELMNIYDFIKGSIELETLRKRMSGKSMSVIETFFNVIYLDKIDKFLPERQRDPFFPDFPTMYFKDDGIIEFYEENITNIKTNATVTSLVSKNGEVEIEYIEQGEKKKVKSKSAIVATPAYVTNKILDLSKSKVRDFFSSIKYAKAITVTFLLEKSDSKKNIPFTYISTPEKSFQTVYRQPIDKETIKYTVFYADYSIENINNENIVSNTVSELKSMNIADFSEERILKHEVNRWDGITVIIDDVYEKYWNENIYNPIDGIFIAGDYTMWRTAPAKDQWSFFPAKLPYGVIQAYRSGNYVSEKVRLYLEK
jgi:hypothetical protein